MSAPSSPARRPTATRVVAVASAVAVAGVAVVRNRQARRETAADAAAALVGPLGATGRSHRSLVTARAATRAGRGWAKHRARRTFADAGRREELDLEHQIRTATEVAETLEFSLVGAMVQASSGATTFRDTADTLARVVAAVLPDGS